MGSITYTAPDGTQTEISLPPGADPAQVVAEFEQAKGITQETTTLGEDATRGAGLAVRNVGFAPARLATTLADLVGGGVNFAGNLLRRGDAALSGREFDPIEFLPTSSTEVLESKLSEFLPENESSLEKIAGLAGDVAFTGGAAGAHLASKLPAVARPAFKEVASLTSRIPGVRKVPGLPKTKTIVDSAAPVVPERGFLQTVGKSFAESPKSFIAAELGGGAGLEAGNIAVEESESPLVRAVTPFLTAAAGALSPTVAVNVGRRVVTGARSAADVVSPGGTERRAARRVQELVPDNKVAAAKALDAPEGVSPARATGEPELLRLEKTILDEDLVSKARVADDLVVAEERELAELVATAGPGTDRAAWQNTVVNKVAPEGVTIKPDHPDIMIQDTVKAYGKAYESAKGHTISTVDSKGVGLRKQLSDAVENADVLTTGAVESKALARLNRRIEKVEKRGTRTGGPDDAPIFDVSSDDIITLRSAVRTTESRLSKAGVTNTDAAEEAELLHTMNGVLTRTLEEQLPADAAAILRATDARYAQFKTVEGAVVRSGEKGLTPEALRASLKSRSSVGKVARGETGGLGQLAEQGKDVLKLVAKGKDDEIQRIVRSMTPEQAGQVRSDIIRDIIKKSTGADSKTSARGLTKRFKDSRASLEAAGATEAQLSRMDNIIKRLTTMQQKVVGGELAIADDAISMFSGLAARLIGAKTASKIVKATGTGGTGSLTITGFLATRTKEIIRKLKADGVEQIITDAILAQGDNKNLLAALLVKSTDSLKRRRAALKTINAWVVRSEGEGQ